MYKPENLFLITDSLSHAEEALYYYENCSHDSFLLKSNVVSGMYNALCYLFAILYDYSKVKSREVLLRSQEYLNGLKKVEKQNFNLIPEYVHSAAYLKVLFYEALPIEEGAQARRKLLEEAAELINNQALRDHNKDDYSSSLYERTKFRIDSHIKAFHLGGDLFA